MKGAIEWKPAGNRLRRYRMDARRCRKPVEGAVPAWIREFAEKRGEDRASLEEIRRILGKCKGSLSDEINRERRGEGAEPSTVRGAMDGDAAKALIERWASDESGYDEGAWSEIREGIERNRLSERKRFRGTDDHS